MARRKLSPWGFVGMAGMTCMLFLIIATVVVAPWWVSLLFFVLWLALLMTAGRWFLPRPERVPWLPAALFVVWALVISVGVRVGGWS